ncbi:uncharacterized protein Smp_200090 [Schistosoma mansoni]|uniref:uncharacterized protein n=1 Tax=Schistosoma mansoni TaxID=6183 RepID=UPI00022DC1F6|nr:uncharacterized protein Smp_200090 [Schistosoma mansoni]|eukprot:XP_018649336.1 uncharacterized protein Smp_200090 [Schistosoma mansoni]
MITQFFSNDYIYIYIHENMHKYTSAQEKKESNLALHNTRKYVCHCLTFLN